MPRLGEPSALAGVESGAGPPEPDLSAPLTIETFIAYRLSRGWTQGTMAGKLGMHLNTVSRWEARIQPMQSPEQIRLALVGLSCEQNHKGRKRV